MSPSDGNTSTPHSTLAAAPPLPPSKVTLLLNNFILSTTRFLNAFVTAADEKIRNVSEKITDMEVMMSILEAKLASVPEVENVGETQNNTQQQQETAPTNAKTELATNPPQTEAQPTPTATENDVPGGGPGPPFDEATSQALVPASTQIQACEHPSYKQFFKLLKIGAPLPAVQQKVVAAGLDPGFMEQEPTNMIDKPGGEEEK
ncbi:hypothetical protein TL16_g10279 [Triparma laevis f. inornata]|uniref:Uncharacterized protein n=2 Tax=Triparma laevis TaxID=1534972 RepID=A0A9W6Z658_9STRA|nr:hypothetical protein TrLO_g12593 [Triparma laevis f. longispina]GMH85595.1 hypothetical protein TL16_g10279 [Triparma laevis f. inornata]